jgi:WD40 repeat protein
MEWIARIRLLIASLAWLLAVGVETAQSAAGKTKVVYLPGNVQVIRDYNLFARDNGDYLLSKGADVDCRNECSTFFIEKGAKLSITGGQHAVFIKKGGELVDAACNTLRIYYEKGAKIGKGIDDRFVRIECDSITFKPFRPFTLKGTVHAAGGKPLAGIRVHAYGFAEDHLDTAITNRDGMFTFRPAKSVAYVAADLAPAWVADFEIRHDTSLSSRRHTLPLRGWEAEIREGCWGQDAILTITPSGERRLLLRRLHKLFGHESGVWSMAFSGDGRTLATAGQGTLVRVWDVVKGKERRVFDTDCAKAEVSLDPNGKVLAAVNGGKSLRLWDVAKGKLLRELNIPPNGAKCLAFAPDGKTLAAGGEQSIHLWDVASGKRCGVWKAHPKHVSTLIFKPDGRTLVSSGPATYMDGNNSISTYDTYDRIHLWDATTGRTVGNLAGEGSRLAFSADGERLASSGVRSRTVIRGSYQKSTPLEFLTVWRVDTGQQLLRIKDASSAIALTPDGKLLAVLTEDVLHFWELASGQEVLVVPLPDLRIDMAFFASDSRTLATAHSSGSVSLWDVHPHHLYVPEAKSRSDAEWEGLWNDLASDKAATAYRALWTLLREPPRAVTLLRTHLRPTPPRELPLDKWIADLDNDDFATRQTAAKSLREAGESAERALRKARGGGSSLEARKRIDQILEAIGQRRASAQELRALRAIQLLEEIGSPETHQFLETLAKGWSEARQTREAKAALARLNGKENRK